MRTSPTGRLAHDLDRASDKDDEWDQHSTRSPAKERFSVASDETQRAGHWWVHLGLEMVVPSPDKGSAGRVWLSTTRSRGALVNHNASQAASQDPLI
jgi:hypothetical protein